MKIERLYFKITDENVKEQVDLFFDTGYVEIHNNSIFAACSLGDDFVSPILTMIVEGELTVGDAKPENTKILALIHPVQNQSTVLVIGWDNGYRGNLRLNNESLHRWLNGEIYVTFNKVKVNGKLVALDLVSVNNLNTIDDFGKVISTQDSML